MASMIPQNFQFLVIAIAGWVNRQQQATIDYLQEENRILREQLGPKKVRFTDFQRRRLASKGFTLGRMQGATGRIDSLLHPGSGVISFGTLRGDNRLAQTPFPPRLLDSSSLIPEMGYSRHQSPQT